MPRSSGTFTAPASSWNPPINGSPATLADWMVLLADLSYANTQALSRDGQSPALANLPMGGFKLTNAAAGATAGDPLVYGQAGGVLATAASNDRSTLVATTAFANPAGINAGNGFWTMPSGVSIQWGQVTTSATIEIPFTWPGPAMASVYAGFATVVNGAGSSAFSASLGGNSTTAINVGSFANSTGFKTANSVWVVVIGK